jgi:hypothetical protein
MKITPEEFLKARFIPHFWVCVQVKSSAQPQIKEKVFVQKSLGTKNKKATSMLR